MNLNKFKEFGLDTTKHTESKIKRFRSMLKLLEQIGITDISEVRLFIKDVRKELKKEEISNVFNTKFGTKYAHSSARDLFNCLQSNLKGFDEVAKRSEPNTLINRTSECLSVQHVISLAEELKKNNNNPNMDNELKDSINKLILKKMKSMISELCNS